MKRISKSLLALGVAGGMAGCLSGGKDAPSAMAVWTLPGKFNAGDVQIYRVNPDNSISRIADIYRNGKRTDYPEEQQFKLKKIN